MSVVRVCVTGEGDGVRGVMLQSFLDVPGDEGAGKVSPRMRRGEKRRMQWLPLKRKY